MAEPITESRSTTKRRQILEAGRELFMSQGFAETSMDQVTAKSGVSKATVYNHFPSKEALFEEAVRTRAEEVFSVLPKLDVDSTEPSVMLTDYFHTLLSILMSQDGACMCFLMVSEGRRFPDNARLIYETGFGRGLAEMSDYLRGLDASGRVHIQNPEWAAEKLLGLMLPPNALLCSAFQPMNIPNRDDVASTVRLFLRGVGTDHQSAGDIH